MIFSDLPSPVTLANPNAFGSKQVAMVSYRQGWNTLQPVAPVGGITNNPSDASWNWAFFDLAFAQAAALNVPIFLRVFFQSNNAPSWAESNILQFIPIGPPDVNVWWDSYFQSAVIATMQAIATRYSTANIGVVSFNIATTNSGDWSVPHATNANWTNTASFQIPAVNGTVNVQTGGVSSGMAAGQYCFIPGAGWYFASVTAGSLHTTLENPGTSGNASPGTTVPINTTIQVSDVATLQGPIYNYTTTRFVNAVTAILSAAHAAFPNAIIDQEVGRSGTLDPYPVVTTTFQYNAATQIAQWGYANLPLGKFSIGKNTLNPSNPVPSLALSQTDNADLYLPAQTIAGSTNTSGTTGSIPARSLLLGQFSWACYDATGEYSPTSTASGIKPYGANNGKPYQNPIPVWQATVQLAKAYGMGILEIYEQDAIHVVPVAGSFSANTNSLGYQPTFSPSQELGVFTLAPTSIPPFL